jgi:FAD/FMN-containing dehydrogenase
MGQKPATTGAIEALGLDRGTDVLTPGDPGYDQARTVFNAMIDRRPAIVLRCRDTTDVRVGVSYAREQGLALSVRGGGHNIAGNAVCDGGIMLDLSGMKDLQVDPQTRIAWAGPGLTHGELDRATQVHGMATPLGVMSATGIAGLTLGGGLGWLNTKHGLSCDNLIFADVVTADATVLRATEEDHPDLLWALRGGGGNFGIVTTFGYRLHPVGPVLAGRLSYPWSHARQALRFYEQFIAAAPDELSTTVSLSLDNTGAPGLHIALCYCGDRAEGQRVLSSLRKLGAHTADTITTVPYLDWQSGPDAGFPTGRLHYWKTGWLQHFSDEAIETMLRFAPHLPSPFSGIGLQYMGGAASRVDPTATAFAHRARQHDFLILSQWSNPADTARNIDWTRAFHTAMQPHLEAGAYINNLGTENPERIQAAYGHNYLQLTRIKKRYDPHNVFHINQNIRPDDAPSTTDAQQVGPSSSSAGTSAWAAQPTPLNNSRAAGPPTPSADHLRCTRGPEPPPRTGGLPGS